MPQKYTVQFTFSIKLSIIQTCTGLSNCVKKKRAITLQMFKKWKIKSKILSSEHNIDYVLCIKFCVKKCNGSK